MSSNESENERSGPDPRLAYDELDLPDEVRRGVADAGFTHCTPIQAETLPTAITGRDIAGQAQTGTGKTAAFLIAAFTLLLRKPRRHQDEGCCPRAMIITPTRELAMQIHEEGKLLGKHTGLTMHAVFGGVDYIKQLDRLAEGVDILIGTPGRLIDYFRQGVFTLRNSEILIVDEADRLFDMGFVDDLRYLVTAMPPSAERVSYLYSATLSQRVLELAYEYMHDVHRVTIEPEQVTAERIDQLVYHVGVEEKLPVLLNLLKREQPLRALIFVNTRRGVHFIADRLERHGYAVGALVGDIDQKKRIRTLKEFKDGTITILVATDVASRGLHIDAVSHVFNYDLPQDPEDYVHRIGRTARAGASGHAYSLACEHHVYSLQAIHEFIGRPIPHAFPESELVKMPRPALRLLREEVRAEQAAAQNGSEASTKKRRSRSKRKASVERIGDAAESPTAETNNADAGESATEAGAAQGPAKKKRRRRRRRKPGAGAAAVKAVTVDE